MLRTTPRRSKLAACLLAFTIAAPASALAESAAAPAPARSYAAEAEHVVLVSFDGLRPDAIAAAGMPHLEALRAEGAHSDGAQAVYPSITLVNHASMVSGVGPKKHRIDWNSYLPWKGKLKVPTVFDLAKKKGLRTALVAGKSKFRHLNRRGTIDRFVVEDGSPRQLADEAVRAFERDRPHLMMVHFRHGDSAGHDEGWMSPAQLRALREADAGLGRLLAGLDRLGVREKTAIVVTADHGGQGRGHGSRHPVDMTIPWVAAGAEIPVRGALKQPIATYDTAATVADLLGLDVPASWDGESVFRKARAPANVASTGGGEASATTP
jgi:arylsulfatase A-like enzyme